MGEHIRDCSCSNFTAVSSTKWLLDGNELPYIFKSRLLLSPGSHAVMYITGWPGALPTLQVPANGGGSPYIVTAQCSFWSPLPLLPLSHSWAICGAVIPYQKSALSMSLAWQEGELMCSLGCLDKYWLHSYEFIIIEDIRESFRPNKNIVLSRNTISLIKPKADCPRDHL